MIVPKVEVIQVNERDMQLVLKMFFCLTLKVFICELPIGFQPINLYNLAIQHVEDQKGFSQVWNQNYVIESHYVMNESYLWCRL